MATSELLQRAMLALEKLPEDEQNAIATHLLAEIEDEQAWAARFEATTEEQWGVSGNHHAYRRNISQLRCEVKYEPSNE